MAGYVRRGHGLRRVPSQSRPRRVRGSASRQRDRREVLRDLTAEDLKEIGATVGDRRKLLPGSRSWPPRRPRRSLARRPSAAERPKTRKSRPRWSPWPPIARHEEVETCSADGPARIIRDVAALIELCALATCGGTAVDGSIIRHCRRITGCTVDPRVDRPAHRSPPAPRVPTLWVAGRPSEASTDPRFSPFCINSRNNYTTGSRSRRRITFVPIQSRRCDHGGVRPDPASYALSGCLRFRLRRS